MEDFVPFEIAKKLEGLGFDESSMFFYREDGEDKCVHCVDINKPLIDDKVIIAPTISQVVSWLEDKKKIFLTVDIEPMGFFFIINYDILTNDNGEYEFNIYNSTTTYPSSIEAALAGIEYVLDNLI
jgi:hypothetical protein